MFWILEWSGQNFGLKKETDFTRVWCSEWSGTPGGNLTDFAFWDPWGGWSREAQQNLIIIVVIDIMIIVTYREVRYWRFKELCFTVSDDFVC
jgi:hypothetical protein